MSEPKSWDERYIDSLREKARRVGYALIGYDNLWRRTVAAIDPASAIPSAPATTLHGANFKEPGPVVVDETERASSKPAHIVIIDYTNWRGERGLRRIRPKRFSFHAHNAFHGAGWLLEAYDLEKGDYREFRITDVHSWREEPDQ